MTADDTIPLPLILPLVTPRFIPICTPELLSALGEIASRHSCHITSHISESIDEVAYSRQLDTAARGRLLGDGFTGRTDAVIFDSHQLLTDQCIMAHGVHLSDADCDLLRQRGAAVAHCPLSNFFFAGAVFPAVACRNGAISWDSAPMSRAATTRPCSTRHAWPSSPRRPCSSNNKFNSNHHRSNNQQ